MAHLKRSMTIAFITSILFTFSSFANNTNQAPSKPAPRPAARAPGKMGVTNGKPVPQARTFSGRTFHGRVAWEAGKWRHEKRNGRYGWWYDVDGAAYFYDQPQYPYPAQISSVEELEPEGGPLMSCAEATQAAPLARARSAQLASEIQTRARSTTFAESTLKGLIGIRDAANTCPLNNQIMEAYLTEMAALKGCPKLDKDNRRRADLEQLINLNQDSIDFCNRPPA